MKKGIIKRIDNSKRDFLTGSVTLAGVAAAASVLPISIANANHKDCLLYTSPSPRDRTRSRMPSSA